MKELPNRLYVHGSVMVYSAETEVTIEKFGVLGFNPNILLFKLTITPKPGVMKGIPRHFVYEEHGTGTGTGAANYNGSSVNTLFRDDSAQSATPTIAGRITAPFPLFPTPINVGLNEFFVLATLNFTALTGGLFEFNFFSDDGDTSTGNEGFFTTASSVGNEIDLAGSINIQAAQVPEPPVIIIMLIGLLGLAKTTKLRKI